MKRFLQFGFILLIAALLSGCDLFKSRKKAALSVQTTPKATIFLDGEHLGQTPYYNEKLKAGEYVLKIVPESSGQALNPWEGRVTLSPGILTVVNRQLGLTQDDSSGEILAFEPLADKKAISISVVTTPDGAVINLDGEPRGFAPLSLDNISEGDHVLVVSSPGYQERSIKAKTVKGHKLIASVQLAREQEQPETPDEDETDEEEDTEESTPSAKASPKPTPKPTPKSSPTSGETPDRPYIEINSGTGWARVRETASTGSIELAKVDHQDQFSLLDETTSGSYDWYKIEYETGKKGWIRSDLADKFE